ncbi:MAG: DUF6228 family protein [Pseudomonadota bacterium]|nr:MAG: hypothetical protein DIU62_02135 [Pseudomonadota bacterium]
MTQAVRVFELVGQEATLRLEGEPPVRSVSSPGWDYRAELQGHSMHVSLVVGDDDPASFVDFFQSLANDQQGWPETRAYESLDGTLLIVATHDMQRTVRFEVRLRADARSGFDWSANHRLSVEAGTLAKLAAAAKAFAS